MSGNGGKHSQTGTTSFRRPSHEEIAERAYARYEARSRSADGSSRSPEDDWFEAERELREAADTPPIEPEETAIYAAPPYPPRAELPTGRDADERSTGGHAARRPSESDAEEGSGEVESFSPRPESAETTHAARREPEKLPPSFSPRADAPKTTRAAKPRAKPKAKAAAKAKRAPKK